MSAKRIWRVKRRVKSLYYIKTTEIPRELSRVNMINITCYFTRENNMLFSRMKRSRLLWLHNPLDLLLYDPNIIKSSSEIFGYLRKHSVIFKNFQKMFGNVRLKFAQLLVNLWKSSESVRKSSEIREKRCH